MGLDHHFDSAFAETMRDRRAVWAKQDAEKARRAALTSEQRAAEDRQWEAKVAADRAAGIARIRAQREADVAEHGAEAMLWEYVNRLPADYCKPLLLRDMIAMLPFTGAVDLIEKHEAAMAAKAAA